MKVKFIVTGSPSDKIYISPAYLMIRAYYDLRGKNRSKVNWLPTVYNSQITVEELFEQVRAESVDVLCLSMYIWNRAQLNHLAKLVKEHMPETVIVAGGPDLDAHCNPNFFKDNPFIDYVVYGDGEEAFTQLLDSIVDQTELSDAVNIVTPTRLYPFKIFQDKEFSELSPWIELKDEIQTVIDRYGRDRTVIYWEMARGCPYSCSFCDWNNGLHNKVKRRRNNWQAEIDLFVKLGVEVRVIDANWGMYKEDLEIHKYAITRLKFTAMNLPKLNKQVAYQLLSLSYEHFPEGRYVVSLQDLNEEVLKNIDRPSPPWPEHKKLIMEFLEKHPKITLKGELIIGLPGQRVDSWIDTLIELEATGIKSIEENIWMILPGSPAYKKDYQKKFSITFDEIVFINKSFDSIAELETAILSGETGWYKSRIVTGTMSTNFAEILTILALSILYNRIHKTYKKMRYADIVYKILPQIQAECNRLAEQVLETKLLVVETEGKIVSFNEYFYGTDFKKLLLPS